MNLALLKELEDLRQVQNRLASQLNEKFDSKVKEYTNLAFQDFEKFFVEQGFKVQKSNQSITANYGSLASTLKYDTPEAPYFGAYFVYDLMIEIQGKTEYNIALNPEKSGSGFSTYSVPKDPDEQLKLEIQKNKESNQRAEARIANIHKEEWFFELRQQNSKEKYAQVTKFGSMYKLLESLFTEHK